MVNPNLSSSDLPELHRRLVFLKIGVLLLIGLLIFRVWQLQVRDGPYYRDLSQDNRTRAIVLRPARGLVYDRNGLLLANNVPSFNLYVELKDVRNYDQWLAQLEQLLGFDRMDLEERLRVKGQRTRVKVKGGLTLREAALIESHRLDLPGTFIQAEYQRNNPNGAYAAHVIGYVGEISEAQLAQEEFLDLNQGSIIGHHGVERTYDSVLRGQAGRKLIEVDALGHEKRMISVDKPQAGDDVYLTIDFRLQKLAEELLGEEAGAIVALDPRNGELLALASQPSFDPNALSRGLNQKRWKTILQDQRHPLTNRAIQGQYPPGSTFKIIMAAAALESQTVEEEDTIQCGGGYRFGRRVFRDWKRGGHGTVDLIQALTNSCDVYFYKIGNRMGIETIAAYSTEFGLGQKTGIDLPSEISGIVPTPAWKKRVKGEPWYPGETISVSIGQGFVTVTPLQMARVIATVANQGMAYQPRLIRAIRRRETGGVEEWPAIMGKRLSLSAIQLRNIQKGLELVVEEGTGKKAQSDLVTIAGKTGTSQVVALRPGPEKDIPKEFRDHAWFVSYAPTEKPRIAVAVLVEHMGHGGSAAAPLAKELIEAFVQFRDGDQSGPPGAEAALQSYLLQSELVNG
jgi:penicillin-binding protein 2